MHFYGMSFEEATSLDHGDAEGLWHAVTQIEAQALLMQLRVADYPTAKRETRNTTHRTFHRLAYPRTQEALDVLTTKQLADKLRAAING